MCSIFFFSKCGTVGVGAGFGGRREKVPVRLMGGGGGGKKGKWGMEEGAGRGGRGGRGGGMCEKSRADMSGNKLKMPISL